MRFLLIAALIALKPIGAFAQADPPPRVVTPQDLQSWLVAKNERLKAHEAHMRAMPERRKNQGRPGAQGQ